MTEARLAPRHHRGRSATLNPFTPGAPAMSGTERGGCHVVRVDVEQSFLDDVVLYVAVCSTGAEFKGATTGEALLAHERRHPR